MATQDHSPSWLSCCGRDGSRRPRGRAAAALGAQLALLRGGEMLPSPGCSLFPWLQWDLGLPPAPAVVSWAPESCNGLGDAGEKLSGDVAGMEQGSVLAVSDRPS